jgi:hypothetical protein
MYVSPRKSFLHSRRKKRCHRKRACDWKPPAPTSSSSHPVPPKIYTHERKRPRDFQVPPSHSGVSPAQPQVQLYHTIPYHTIPYHTIPYPPTLTPLDSVRKESNGITIHTQIIRPPGLIRPINRDHLQRPHLTKRIHDDIVGIAFDTEDAVLAVAHCIRVFAAAVIVVLEEGIQARAVDVDGIGIDDAQSQRVAYAGWTKGVVVGIVVVGCVERVGLAFDVGGGLPVGRFGLDEAGEDVGCGAELELVEGVVLDACAPEPDVCAFD